MCFSVFLRLPVITLSSFCSSYPCFMTVIRGQRDQSSPQSSSGEIQGWLWHDESRWVPDQRSSFRHSTLTLTPCSCLFKWRKINRLWFWLDTWKCVVFHVRAITEWMASVVRTLTSRGLVLLINRTFRLSVTPLPGAEWWNVAEGPIESVGLI